MGAQMENIIVEGANGGLHTNYYGKAMAAVKALLEDGKDFAYIHVEAPDEMGHQGNLAHKIEAIESIDEKVVKTVAEALDASEEPYRMLVLPDHPTPIRIRTHSADPVPYMLYDSTRPQCRDWLYNEKDGQASGNYVAAGHEMIEHLFK